MKYLKSVFNGLSFMFLFILVILSAPIVMLLLGYTDFKQDPSFLGYNLYVIEIQGTNFSSSANFLGLLFSFLIGVIIYFLFQALFNRNKHQK
ncbi:hypothetical protein KFZ58_00095 [Virgibacillus sp. NKC19-16]|uniref:hypothetical protein n=1 Tax=Virgibacillus salidurans TaxID=2831673 RepID=UPI001F26F6B3|nr:hypothetical protein [Virgibacillus sp. NKC19-16]UJL46427.1 hypothetical protein KFZ58_00095 [Virgibacillus sp. NKC19-16]